jgi:LacI family transcriptional regulator
MSITIKEVAREAGVSVATVSRALNDKGPVAEDTRRRIQEVAQRLRYVPHGAARSLITNRTSTIGVLLPDLYGEFYSEVIRGIDRMARRRDYHLLVSSSHNVRTEVEAAFRAMRGRVDGLIVMTPDIERQTLEANLPASLPVVLMNCRVEGDAYDSINIDNYGGAWAVVRHFIDLGHRRIALIKGPPRNLDSSERLRGFRAAMRELGGEWALELELDGAFTEESGHGAAVQLLDLQPRPTAVFASNDSMAIGALSAFGDAGVRVPDDLALAGFDDIPIARFMTPPITSVHVPISELGSRAMDRLLVALEMENEHERRHERLPTRLVVRSSCGGGAVRETIGS